MPPEVVSRLAEGLLEPAARAALAWEPFRPGVEAYWLYRTPGGGAAAALLRYQPGAAVPHHRHAGREHVLVLEGSQRDADGTYVAGDLVVNEAGTEHHVRSEEGCVVLLIWERAPVLREA